MDESLMALWLVVGGIVGAAIGWSKNAVLSSAVIGAALGPIGWIVAVVSGGNLKKCSQCAESVKPEAIICKHCGSRFADGGKPKSSITHKIISTVIILVCLYLLILGLS